MVKIFNTLTRQKEILQPLKPNQVGMYVCGVTVYDYCHIGHARTYVSMDVIIRYLQFRGFDVQYVRNITDIDDKIIKRANETGQTYEAITEFFTNAMQEDFIALNLLKPQHEPRATEYIPQMIAFIEKLLTRQHAYIAANGDVYFDVRSAKNYGCLSHHDIEQLESGARVEVVEVKKDPLDFVLWKLAKPNEPKWQSPWGEGRPGWHTECAVMSLDLLGQQFDIHGGGRDLIFPHHENEIAQASAAENSEFAKLWIHGGFLQIDKEKMSKSLGNFVSIRDVLKEYSNELLRYLLIASHYRSPLIYTEDSLSQSHQALTRFYNALRFLPDVNALANSMYESKFCEAMDDDFNTPVALSVLFDLSHQIHRLKEINVDEAAQHGALLRKLGSVLGILQSDPEQFLKAGLNIDVEKIEQLIAARELARQQKNWQEADKIRNELLSLSIAIEDTPSGTTWKTIK